MDAAKAQEPSVIGAGMVDEKPCEAEREMHDEFQRWLAVHEKGPIPFVHSRMDRKSTIRSGFPDFGIFFGGKCCFVEFKMPDNGLSSDQCEVIAEMINANVPVTTSYSVTAAIEFTREKLGL
jgi:hypothetical protein